MKVKHQWIFGMINEIKWIICVAIPLWPSVAKCGGEAQHLEKLEVGSLSGLPNVQSSIEKGKTPRIGVFLVSLERSWNVDIENALALAIRTSAAKLWAKEGSGVKLAVWLPTTKSRESTSSRCPIWVCDMALERSRWGLQLWFRPHRNPTLQSGVMAVQSSGSPAGTISRPLRESREFVPFGCSLRDQPQRILYRGRWWLPPNPGRGESCASKCPWQVLTPKGVPECELITWVVCFGADSCLIY
jgi:hypothetical protein